MATVPAKPAREALSQAAPARRPRRRLVLATAIVLLLIGAGIAAWRLLLAAPALPPGVVAVSGRVEGDDSAIASKTSGRIREITVREGDVVKKGDFLLQIDRKQLAASAQGAQASVSALFSDRDAARATLADAQRTYERARNNFEQKIIPQAELDSARTAVESARANVSAIDQRIQQARANVAAAQDTLSKTTMTAPMSGIITALPVEEGEVAVIGTMNNAGTKLLTIADMSIVEAVMEVDETDVPNVKVGQRATVTIDAYPNKTFDGLVTEVGSSPMVSQLGSTSEAVNFEVKIQLTNPPPGVRPGFSASADIITGTRPKALAIPIQALVVREKEAKKGSTEKGKEEEGVYLHKDGKAQFVPVVTGLAGDSNIEIVKGLAEGQQIITGPFRALRDIKDGAKVRELKEDKKKEDSEKKES